ncbi:MAG TPA: DUF1707 domain-containing protein [Pseudonocardiaceae bacterium]|jgi:hypothetical protein
MTVVPMPVPPPSPELRLSDVERERAVAVFNDAVADGRLTWPEHAERVELVWTLRTRDQLAPYLADLGVVGAGVVGAGREPQRVVARASKIIRKAERGRRVEARSLFGAVYVDLTDAAPGEELQVDATSFCGKVVLTVGRDATVVDEGEAVLGKRKILVSAPDAAGGPLIRITGRSTLGHLKVYGPGRRWW